VRAKNLLSKCILGKNETQGEAGSHWAFIVCSWSSNVRKARKSPPPPPQRLPATLVLSWTWYWQSKEGSHPSAE